MGKKNLKRSTKKMQAHIGPEDDMYLVPYDTDDYFDDADSADYTPPQIYYNDEVPKDKGAARAYRIFCEFKAQFTLQLCERVLYVYNLEQGCFRPYAAGSQLNRFIEGNVSGADRRTLGTIVRKEITEKLLTAPELYVEAEGFNANPRMINCQNGVINFSEKKVELLPHSADFRFTYAVQAEYHPNSVITSAPKFFDFCTSSFADDIDAKIRLLLEIIGYTLCDNTFGKCMLFGIGVSHSGKSVLADVISSLLLREQLTHLSLHQLSNRFNVTRLFNSKANIQAEMNSKTFKDVALVKNLAAGDWLTAEVKGGESFDFAAKNKFLYFGNTLPKPAEIDPTDGFFNRLVVLRFQISIPKEKWNLKLREDLYAERDVIFSLAMDALCALHGSGYKFSMPEDSLAFLRHYKASSNSLLLFLTEKTIKSADPQSYIPIAEFKERYEHFCATEGLDLLSLQAQKEVFEMYGVQKRRLHRGEFNAYAYEYLSWSDITVTNEN